MSNTKRKSTGKCTYVLGLESTGGAWIPNERSYSTMEMAEKIRAEVHGKDARVKIFTLYEYEEDKAEAAAA